MARGYSFFGSNLSYVDYLTAHEFVTDLNKGIDSASKRISFDISHQTRELIASNEAVAQANILATEISAEQITDTIQRGIGEFTEIMGDGFSRISYQLQEVSAGIEELNATFNWGFSQMLATMGRMNDSLTELIKIAKTPVQTAAFEQYEIARDAFRQGLYIECLESLDRSINGDRTFSGHKLEWRFHQMKGVVHLGFFGCDSELVDLAKAEESFLLAARYAKADYPEHAAQALLSAGWAAYCLGKMAVALEHSEQALVIKPNLGEALFQVAKVRIAMGDVDSALSFLGSAIKIDLFYIFKAAGDGDFQLHDEKLRKFLDVMRKEKFLQMVPKVEEALNQFSYWLENVPSTKENQIIREWAAFPTDGLTKPLLDLCRIEKTLSSRVEELKNVARNDRVRVSGSTSSLTVPLPGEMQVEESYQERVVVKPGGFFRRDVIEMQPRTRTVVKKLMVDRRFEIKPEDNIVDGMGKAVINHSAHSIHARLELCHIPAGTFKMGGKIKVNISHDFYLGKYPVTQEQWEAVMGFNPSGFKGLDRPVESVTWYGCQEFVTRLNSLDQGVFRLPTEAEWEYACRAGSTSTYYFGNDESGFGEYAWYQANSEKRTHRVGQKEPNAWGLYDMHGNVSEWCQDWSGDYPQGPLIDPQGNLSPPLNHRCRVNRGGCWLDTANNMRSDSRSWCEPETRSMALGFRVVVSTR